MRGAAVASPASLLWALAGWTAATHAGAAALAALLVAFPRPRGSERPAAAG